MELASWFERNVIEQSFLSEEHEDYLLSRGARLEDIDLWKIRTFYPPLEPCPDSLWEKKLGKYWQKLSGALVVPVFSTLGKLLGFEWRIGQRRQKIWFRDSETRPIWFGMPFEMEKIWNLRIVWVVEGYLDALVLKRVTKYPVLAAGTANLSEAQIRFLERFCDEVRVAFDQDKPGDMGYWMARKKVQRKDLKFIRWEYGVRGDDPPLIWDRGGLPLLKDIFEED